MNQPTRDEIIREIGNRIAALGMCLQSGRYGATTESELKQQQSALFELLLWIERKEGSADEAARRAEDYCDGT